MEYGKGPDARDLIAQLYGGKRGPNGSVEPNAALKAAAGRYNKAIQSGELVNNTEPFLPPKR